MTSAQLAVISVIFMVIGNSLAAVVHTNLRGEGGQPTAAKADTSASSDPMRMSKTLMKANSLPIGSRITNGTEIADWLMEYPGAPRGANVAPGAVVKSLATPPCTSSALALAAAGLAFR